MKVLLIGNPNVGKSVIFSRLTGIQVVASNYPGSTVNFKQGFFKIGGQKAEIIDVPGTYSLKPTSAAEEVAVKMIPEGDIIVCVIDATRLERSLPLTLQLLDHKRPMLVVLNIWDETKHKGIQIDIKKLSEFLSVPVITTSAITGEGIRSLVDMIPKASVPDRPKIKESQQWLLIGEIINQVQTVTHRHHTLTEKFQDFTIRPFGGILIAFLVLSLSFFIIRFLGEGLIGLVFEPLFEIVYKPLLLDFSQYLGGKGVLHDILIGNLINGDIDFNQSFGLISTGLFVPIGIVFPYVLSFYFILGILEDYGYLPRLAILLDVFMHRIGLHGYAIIPTVLGLGCNVPGILATRILESKRERFIACTLISIGIPCASLHAMIFGLVGARGLKYVLIIYVVLAIVWICLGLIMNMTIKGFTPELFTEIPPYRNPVLTAVFKKLWMRMKAFLKEAVPIVLIGVLIINLFYSLRIFDVIADFFAPVINGLMGLPDKAVTALVIGFLRKDVAVGMLAPLGLTNKQVVIGCVTLAMFFPCVATFVVMLRELGWKDMLKASAIMLFASVIVATLINILWP
ncbi:MAG: ferrous iron transporter B [Deltaproteobacteria bacterium]|nr:ferrous iron transporter B [Deltaproteobacteria bacterium]